MTCAVQGGLEVIETFSEVFPSRVGDTEVTCDLVLVKGIHSGAINVRS